MPRPGVGPSSLHGLSLFHRPAADLLAAESGKPRLPPLGVVELLPLDQADEAFRLYQPHDGLGEKLKVTRSPRRLRATLTRTTSLP